MYFYTLQTAARQTGPAVFPRRCRRRARRCLIPADGFYEWAGERGRKKARHFTVRGGGLFAFAGLWDAWGAGKDRLLTACLVTTAANDLVRTVHDRMSAVVPPESYAEWLDPATPERRRLELLLPYPAEGMEVREVGPAVNSPRNGGPECLEAA